MSKPKLEMTQGKNLIVKPKRFKPKMPIVKPKDSAVGSGSFVRR